MNTGDTQGRQARPKEDPQAGTGSLPDQDMPGAPGAVRKDAGRNTQQEGGQPHSGEHASPHVSKISREDAERNLAPDPDPDDPVSP